MKTQNNNEQSYSTSRDIPSPIGRGLGWGLGRGTSTPPSQPPPCGGRGSAPKPGKKLIPGKAIWILCGVASLLVLAGCGSTSHVPRGVKVGKPYTVDGQTYTPGVDISYDKVGTASWYGPGFHGGRTATGEVYDQHALTAAHPTLPMPSLVRVTNLSNGKSAVVRINDRGPFKGGRIIDLSKASAEALGFKGLAQVRVQYLPQETAEYIASLGVAVPPEMQYNRVVAQVDDSAQDIDEDTETLSSVGLVDESTATIAPLASITASDIDAPAVQPPITTAREEYAQTSSPGGKLQYYIQAGSFSLRENAGKLLNRLASISSMAIKPLAIQEVTVAEKTFYRVRVGPIASNDLANDMLEKIRSTGATEAKLVLD